MVENASSPDVFDRQLGALIDLPDVHQVKPSTIRSVPPLGIGGTQLFVVQTLRQADRGDWIFVEVVGSTTTRIVLPPAVANVIARQRDVLSSRARSKAAKAVAADRKAKGIQPGFLRTKKK